MANCGEGTSSAHDDNIMKHVPFSALVKLYTKIRKSTGKIRSDVLKNYVSTFRKFEEDFRRKRPNSPTSFFPILRLLIPKSDRERDAYGIKQTAMGRHYVNAMGFHENSEEAKMITMKLGHISGCSDYADVVYKVISNRCKLNTELTVFDVNQYLDSIAECARSGMGKEIENIFVKIIETASAEHQLWIIRLILKKLHLGIGERSILGLFHPKANALYAQLSSLSRACEVIESGNIAEQEDVVNLFQPLRSMLCEPLKLSRLETLLKQSDFYVELKMDGERMQIHRNGKELRFFSRNSDATEIFRDSATNLKFSNSLLRHIKPTSVILDGEIMVWDKEKLAYKAKGENFDVKYLDKHPNLKPVYCVFDILFLNGKSMIMKPYQERVRVLESMVVPQAGILTINERKKMKDSKEILDFLNKAIDKNEEGIVLKDQDSVYHPGERHNSGWYKIKPDYIEGVVSDLDLLIIGAFFNKNQMVESFLLGVTVSEAGTDHEKLKFYSTCTVRVGLNRNEWDLLNNSLKPHWITIPKTKTKNNKPELNPSCMNFGNSVPDVWIEPKNSIILEIRAAELVKTSTFKAGYTLRFPRIKTIRSDKPYFDCCTLSELEGLAQQDRKIEKLAKRHVDQSDLDRPIGKRKRLIKSAPSLPESKKDLPKIDDVLKDLEFCVLSCNRNGLKISQIEDMISRHGGIIVKNPGTSTFAIVAGDLFATVKKYMATNQYDIVKPDWVARTLGKEVKLSSIPRWKPTDMIAIKPKTREDFDIHFDEYNDSFTDPIEDEDELKTIMDSVDLEVYNKLLIREIAVLEEEVLEESEMFNFFSQILAYFQTEKDLVSMVFRSRRGVIVDDIALASHVIVNHKDSVMPKVPENCRIVSSQWILKSNKVGRLLDDAEYLIV